MVAGHASFRDGIAKSVKPRPIGHARDRFGPVAKPLQDHSGTPGREKMIVRMGIIKRKADLSPARFRDHWRTVHGPLAARFPGLRRYHQNHVVDASQLAIDHARGAWDVDGFSQLWFDDLDAMRRAVASPAFPPTVPDISNFVGSIKLVVCEPNVVVPVDRNAGPLIKRMSILRRRHDIDAERFRKEWFGFHADAVK